jgi:phage gp16-like protein
MNPRAANPRTRDLAAIHVAKKALQLDDDAYRDLMATVCGGIRSAGELDHAGRQRFRAHLEACVKASQARPAKKAIRRELEPYERKIWALWMKLADAGRVHQRSMQAINAWVKRQTGVDSIAFLTAHQVEQVIESLKLWLDRGREPEVPA